MPLLSKNIELGPPLRLSSWRKIALGTWKTAGDPSVYGMVDVEVSAAIAYLEKMKAKTGQKLTMTHFVGKAIAEVLRRHPDINCLMRYSKLYPRKNIDVFFQVASDDSGKDLSGTTIRNADQKSLPEIAEELQKHVRTIRNENDPAFRQMKKTMGLLPSFLTKFVLGFAGFLMYTLNLWTPLLGSPRDPFGSVMVTSIGSLGLDMAFVPLVPYSRVPLLIAVGAARQVPVVRGGGVQAGLICKICVTFDHRLIDGVHASHMAKSFLKIFEQPEVELSEFNRDQRPVLNS